MLAELSSAELEYLRRVLLEEFEELRNQISNTDTSDFRAQLQRDETMLREIPAGLGGRLPGEIEASEPPRMDRDETDAPTRRQRRLVPGWVRVTRVRLGPPRSS